MKIHRDLLLDEIILPPTGEWRSPGPAWYFLRVAQGTAYWLSRAANKELTTGELVVASPSSEGVIRASQLGLVQIHCFQFSPELLGGFFTLSERQHIEALASRSQQAAQFLLASHPTARRFAALVAPRPSGAELSQRCDALSLVTAFFAEELTGPNPVPVRSPYPIYRFRQLIQQMSNQEILTYTPEQLALLCHCTSRHFKRLFREQFGVSLRTRQTELRLQKARQMLEETRSRVGRIAQETGFRDPKQFSASFQRLFGCGPEEWRNPATRNGEQARQRVERMTNDE